MDSALDAINRSMVMPIPTYSPVDQSTLMFAGSGAYTPIDDPRNYINQQQPGVQQTAPVGGGGGGTTYKDTSAQIAAAQAALDALGTVQTNKMRDEDVAYGNLQSLYNTEKEAEQGRYREQITGNEKSLSSGNQAAMLAAAQGGRGLRATLAAMGALGGTGSVLADRAIMDSANKDLGGARENFETNAQTLQTAWGQFEDQDKRRRREALTTRDTNKQAVEGDILSERQKLLQDMASYYEQAGNTGGYNSRMAEATALTPEIASKSRPRSAYREQSASFQPGELQNYLAGARDMTVGRQAGAQGNAQALNNPLYAFSQKKEEELV